MCLRPATLSKKRPWCQVFFCVLWIFKNINFYRTPLVSLPKYCKSKNFYIIIYFHSIKINLYSMKCICFISLFFMISIYIFIQSIKFVLNEIFFLLDHCFFHVIKIYFYSIKIILHSIRNIFTIYIFFNQEKYFFYYMNFPFITFLVSISGFLFVFTKVRILY